MTAITVAISQAELNARLLRIQPVSWQWNWKGLLVKLTTRDVFKPWNRTEQGVISQNVRDELADAYPDIVAYKKGVLHVDYGTLANLAYDNFDYLQQLYKKQGLKGLDIIKLREEATDVADPQASVVRLLLLTRRVNGELDSSH